MTRYIKKEITIYRNIDEVFDALISPSMIKKWWFVNTAIVLPKVGGFYAAAWGADDDHPDYINFASITEFERPYKLTLVYEKYYSKEGPLPFDINFNTAFTLEEAEGKTILRIMQDGFPVSMAADEFYQGCIEGWDNTFESLKNVLENG